MPESEFEAQATSAEALPMFWQLLRRTGLDNIFRVYGNNEEAVAAFRKQVA
jgi:hypothetical protein